MSGTTMQDENDGEARLTGSGWAALIVLLGFLGASIWYAVYAWGLLGIVHMSAFGWFALIFGSLLTIAVGGGLMALMFYSDRHHYDR